MCSHLRAVSSLFPGNLHIVLAKCGVLFLPFLPPFPLPPSSPLTSDFFEPPPASSYLHESSRARALRTSGLRSGQMINQFPYEAALVVKSHLARTIQREFGSDSPEADAMQPTFDMQVLSSSRCLALRLWPRLSPGHGRRWC